MAKLVLEDGTSFSGFSFASKNAVSGEVVFNTGMTGYPESLTDPSYEGQILVLTYPLIGNYGVPSDEKDAIGLLRHFESENIHIRGLVISDYSKAYSHAGHERSLAEWLHSQGIPAICGIDTRMLTKKLREKGVMLGKIVFDDEEKQPTDKKQPADKTEFSDPNKNNLVDTVSVKEPVVYGDSSCSKTAVLIDCGVKNNIIRSLVSRGIRVVRVPWGYDIFQPNFEKFDGVFVSNGPGDPKMCKATIETLRKAMDRNLPIMGICLGNQLLSLAAGADTYKLKYGHRGQNQPCINLETGRCYITSQNHGFAVDTAKLPKDWEPWFVNANDNTNEGIRHKTKPFCSVQFHPEATPGPVDTGFLFDRFREMIG
jgi:carbamoyl-phosphate synthase small subunit